MSNPTKHEKIAREYFLYTFRPDCIAISSNRLTKAEIDKHCIIAVGMYYVKGFLSSKFTGKVFTDNDKIKDMALNCVLGLRKNDPAALKDSARYESYGQEYFDGHFALQVLKLFDAESLSPN